MPRRFLTSESVTEGHVDKICDLVSDSVLDDILSKDKNARVDCETFITQSHVLLTGQITTSAQFDVKAIARQVIKDVGYNDARTGLDWKSCAVWDAIEKQSPELGEAVSRESGAGDSGVVFGYATNETPELMPLPIVLAHRITRGLDDARKSRELPFLRPDGKAQVTVEYDSDGRPRINNVVVAAQHDNTVTIERVQQQVRRAIFEPAIFTPLFDVDTKVYINVKRRFEIGGSMADTGLTGRKTAVDAYGGYGSHGGGCFSGKDPTKIDRSGSYMARYIAKNVVAAGLSHQCEVQIAYALGVAEPVSFQVTSESGPYTDENITKVVRQVFDLRPSAIITQLDLLRPIYRKTACYGHFGRSEPEFTWEQTDKVEALKTAMLKYDDIRTSI